MNSTDFSVILFLSPLMAWGYFFKPRAHALYFISSEIIQSIVYGIDFVLWTSRFYILTDILERNLLIFLLHTPY